MILKCKTRITIISFLIITGAILDESQAIKELILDSPVASTDGPLYDSSAYIECQLQPEPPLYDGGLLKDDKYHQVNSSSFLLKNLDQGTTYSFSIWIKTNNADPALIRARFMNEEFSWICIGSVIAKNGCWSFLKGGFVLSSPSKSAEIHLQDSDGRDASVEIASASLQPFTEQQWRFNQDTKINETRKRAVTIHVSDKNGIGLQGAALRVELVLKDFPFGSAISDNIIGNLPYQEWFVERFNTAVFEDQLKWYATEAKRGIVNYTMADEMLEFARSNQIIVRGHCILWPRWLPFWALNLTGSELESAVDSRIQNVTSKYKGEFIHWDVDNEELHYHLFEERIRPDAALQFYKAVQQADPLASLFMNEFNVVETCEDDSSNVDAYISRLKELQRSGVSMLGVGLQGHFAQPNPPLMRGVLDKFAALGLPIWLTEVDISAEFDQQTQALYLEEVLREAYSHPAVDGIVLWTALRRRGNCYRMCLTDTNFTNLPPGDVVDKLIREWDTKVSEGQTNERGSYTFFASLGEYRVSAEYGNKTVDSTFSVSRSKETRHFNVQL